MQDKQRKIGSLRADKTSPSENQVTLDSLSAKLLKSEIDREKLQKLLEEAMDSQDRLENQLERSHIDIQRRINSLEVDSESDLSNHTFNELLNTQRDIIDKLQNQIKGYDSQQMVVEDKVNDNNHLVSKLQRKIDAQEQKRTRLERRIQRVENIAKEAQESLNAKALVLLTDQSEAARLALPNVNITDPLPTLHNDEQPNQIIDANQDPQHYKYIRFIGLICLLALATGLGWFLAHNSLSDVTNVTSKSPVSVVSESIEEDIALLSTDWITQDILNQTLEIDMVDPVLPSQTSDALNNNLLIMPELLTDIKTSAAIPDTLQSDPNLPVRIIELEEKAFEGLAEAQHDMAALYVSGQAGVTQDYIRAMEWFKLAARQGIANAAYNLGVMNQQGMGVDKNIDLALNWYRRAGQLGHAEAEYNLGIAYIEGIGAPYNPKRAAAFFKKAAFGGINEAAYNLGLILENGLLNEVRLNEALIWYRGAANNGNAEAQTALETLAMAMSIDIDNAGLFSDGSSLESIINGEKMIESLPQNIALQIDLTLLIPNNETVLIAEIQEQLRQVGFYNGSQEGVLNKETIDAINAYQIKEKLPIDGGASQNLLAYMLAEQAF
jgi:hypothetical protein